jgi:hypothetical protein
MRLAVGMMAMYLTLLHPTLSRVQLVRVGSYMGKATFARAFSTVAWTLLSNMAHG